MTLSNGYDGGCNYVDVDREGEVAVDVHKEKDELYLAAKTIGLKMCIFRHHSDHPYCTFAFDFD